MKQIDKLIHKARAATAPEKEEIIFAMVQPTGNGYKATLHISSIADVKAFTSGRKGAADIRQEEITADTIEGIETLIKQSKYNTMGDKMPVTIIDNIPRGAASLPAIQLPPVIETGA